VTERTKAIMPVHLAGQPADLDPILALGLPVIEDAAHAAESRYRGRKVGGISTAACFSLYATKNIAAGEGGLVATDSDEVAEAIRSMRLTRRGDGSLYDQVTAGFKANLSDVLAAIALVQLDRVEAHAAIRERQFALYDEGSPASTAIAPLERDRRTRTRCTSTSCGSTPRGAARPRRVPAGARGELIGTSIHFLPVHRLTWFRERYPTSRACRSPSAPATRCCRCRSRPRTRTTTSSTRRRRSAACTRGSRHERHRTVPRLSRVKRPLRISSGHADDARVAYILLKIDIHQTWEVLKSADLGGSGLPSRS
jgi:dTDP-4-amino-4,6-dideoxygalactose transaminase